MKPTNNLLPSRSSRRRPPRPTKDFVRTLPPRSENQLENAINELDHKDTFWTGYVRLLIFVIILAFIGTIAVSL